MQLRPYQIEGRDFLAERTFALLADEMRVGKTPQAILAAAKVGAQRVLVVCPAIARRQWEREFARWAPVKHLTVVSYDRARIDQDRLTAAGPYDVCIVDEAHYLKNPEAARTLAVYGKEGVARAARRVWALTGTPAPNHAGELWTLLRLAGRAKCTYEEFLNAYCVRSWPDGTVRGTKVEMIPELRKLLSPIMLRRKRADVAPELGNIQFEYLPVRSVIAPETRRTTVDDMADLPRVQREAPTLRSELALVKAQPLAQQVLADLPTIGRTVVFAYHHAGIDSLADVLKGKATIGVLTGQTNDTERQRLMSEFQSGRLEVLVAQLIAAGTAIDLSAADHGYFLELDWVPANNAQAAARLVAIGKITPVSYDVATLEGSIDESIQRVLTRKTRELVQLFDNRS